MFSNILQIFSLVDDETRQSWSNENIEIIYVFVYRGKRGRQTQLGGIKGEFSRLVRASWPSTRTTQTNRIKSPAKRVVLGLCIDP